MKQFQINHRRSILGGVAAGVVIIPNHGVRKRPAGPTVWP